MGKNVPSKERGRPGYSKFDIFNKALLAKQAWRVLAMPNSLIARVLKGKYFPSQSFLEVKVNLNASYTWKSILSAKDILLKGACRVIGDGMQTSIWSDPWVTQAPNSKIQQRVSEKNEVRPQRVCELIEDGRWKEEMLNLWFSAWEVKMIKRIPLPVHKIVDVWMWKHTKNGQFIVKSAYYMELLDKHNNIPNNSSLNKKVMW